MSNRITLETSFAADKDGLKNVSLITTGIEASGHGIFLDEKTAETAMKKMLGRSVKSYLRHDGAGGDRLGQEIGFFSGIYRAGSQIKASAFSFLESFRKDAGVVADRLIELAQKVPDQIGVSLVLEYAPVWVMPDGTEMQARRGEPAPDGALQGMPHMRVLDVISADFVGRPAANPNGLLSADARKPVDETNPNQTPIKMETVPATTAPAEKSLTVTESTAAVVVLAAESPAAVAPVAPAPEVVALEAHTAALAAKDAEILTLSAQLAEKSALIETGEDELAGALDALETAEAELATLRTFDARKLGVPPLRIASAQRAQADAALNTPQAKWEHYQKLPEGSRERIDFAAKHFDALNAHQSTLSAPK